MNYSILFIICILLFFFFIKYKNEHFVNYSYKPKDKVCLTTRKPYINNVFNSSNYINPEIHDSKSNYYIRNFTNEEIDSIIKKITLKNSNKKYREITNKKSINQSIINNTFNYIEKLIVNLFKFYINSHLKKLHCSSLNNCLPEIISKKIIKIEKNNTNNYKFYTHIELLVRSRSYSYIFFIIIEYHNNNYLINHMKLIGINFTDNIKLLPGRNTDDKYIHIYYDNAPYRAYNDYLKMSTEDKIIIKKHKPIEPSSLDDKIFSYRDKHCYGKAVHTKNECELEYNLYGKRVPKGIWK